MTQRRDSTNSVSLEICKSPPDTLGTVSTTPCAFHRAQLNVFKPFVGGHGPSCVDTVDVLLPVGDLYVVAREFGSLRYQKRQEILAARRALDLGPLWLFIMVVFY